MNTKRNAVGWFEIPVANMDRAIAFYQGLLDVTLSRNTMGPLDMAWFPFDGDAPGSSGSLVKHEAYVPSEHGALLYFTSPSGDIANEESNIEALGGTLLQGKKLIAEDYGYMLLFKDTEGNRIALHSRN